MKKYSVQFTLSFQAKSLEDVVKEILGFRKFFLGNVGSKASKIEISLDHSREIK